MRKLLALILVLIVIVVAASPFVEGYMFKREYMRFINNINAEGQYKIDVLEYSLGWRTSTVRLNISAIYPDYPAGIVLGSVEQTITHGPLVNDPIKKSYTTGLASIQTYLHGPQMIESMLLGANTTSGFMQIASIAKFGNEVTNEISMTPISFNYPVFNSSWQGISGTINFQLDDNARIQTMDSSMTISAFNFDAQDPKIYIQQIRVAPMNYQSQMTLPPNQLASGNTSLSLASASMRDNTGNTMSLNQLNSKTTFGPQGNDLYNIGVMLTVNGVNDPAYFIPTVNNINFGYSLENLSAAGIHSFIQHREELQRSLKGLSKDEMVQKTFDQVKMILTPTTDVKFNLSFATPLGNFMFDTQASLLDAKAAMNNYIELGANVNLTLNVKISKTLTNKLIEQYAPQYAAAPKSSLPLIPGNEKESPLNLKVADYVKAGKIPLQTALQIMQNGSDKMDAATFGTKLDDFKLAPDVSTDLKNTYQEQLTTQAAEPTPATPTQSPVDAAKAKLQSLISQGLITEDADNYSTTIVKKGNVITVNGKVYQ